MVLRLKLTAETCQDRTVIVRNEDVHSLERSYLPLPIVKLPSKVILAVSLIGSTLRLWKMSSIIARTSAN